MFLDFRQDVREYVVHVSKIPLKEGGGVARTQLPCKIP